MGSTLGNATTTMMECCDSLNGVGFMSNGQCMECPGRYDDDSATITSHIYCTVARCYSDASCGGSTLGNATTTMMECCDSLNGVGFMSNGQCMECPGRYDDDSATITSHIYCTVARCYSDASCGGSTLGNATTTMMECCDSLNGVGFMSNGQCMECPGRYDDDSATITSHIYCTVARCYSDASCGGSTLGNATTTMMECCDSLNGVGFMSNGQCMECPGRYDDDSATITSHIYCTVARCYSDASCGGSTLGNATTTMMECCDSLNGMAFMSNGQCMECMMTGAGMDPHFAVPLLNGQDMCYSLQGEPYFAFNLISDPIISINSYFIPPEKGNTLNEFTTFLGDIGILVQPEECKGNCNQDDITKIAISASDRSVLLDGSRTKLKNRHVQVFVENSTATIKLGSVLRKEDHPSLTVTIKWPPLAFTVQFVNEHLDLIVKDFSGISSSAHGIMGKFITI